MRLLFVAAMLGLVGNGAPASSAPASAPALEMTISTDKTTYAKGEDIVLTVALHNRGTTPITVVHPDYWGVSTIAITDDRGHAVEAQLYKADRKAVAELMTIPPGDTRTTASTS